MPTPLVLGVGAALANGFAGQWRDSIQYRRQKELNKENNEFNAREAAKQRAASAAAQADQQRYNSEQAQVSRLKQAGLNPALLYGGATSSSSISSQSAASASPSSYSPSGNQFDFSGLPSFELQDQLQQAQIRNLDKNTENQGQDVLTKETTNRYVDAKAQNDLIEQVARINKMISETDLNEESKNNLIAVRDATISQMLANARNANAQASYTEGAQTDLAESQSNLNKEKSKTESTIRQVNRANAAYTEGAQTNLSESQTNLNNEKVNTEKTLQVLQQAETALRNVTTDDLRQKYNLDKDEIEWIQNKLDSLGIPRAFTKSITNFFGEFSKGTGKGLSEFFSGNTWLNFIQNHERTNAWSRPQQGSDESPVQQTPQIDNQPSQNMQDAVKTVPSDENFNKHTKQLWNSFPQGFKEEYNKSCKWLYDKLQKSGELAKFKKELYYIDNPNDFMNAYYQYYYREKYR